MDDVLTRALLGSHLQGEHYHFRGGERSVDGAIDEDLSQEVRFGTRESPCSVTHTPEFARPTIPSVIIPRVALRGLDRGASSRFL